LAALARWAATELGRREDGWAAVDRVCRGEEPSRNEETERGWLGWAKREKRGREEGCGVSFFKLLFKLYKLHSNKHKTMHSNYDAQALIVSNIIEMTFKYLKANFI
jgi:hypothetical protein